MPRKKALKDQTPHRFTFRDRQKVQRQIYQNEVLPAKRLRYRESSSSSQLSDSDAYGSEPDDYLFGNEMIIPQARTQANKVYFKRKKRRVVIDTTQQIIQDVVDKLIDCTEQVNSPDQEKQQSLYINCDLRYYNFDYIVQKYGVYDIIVIDPPWRIRGGQKNSDSPYMFSNNKFTLEYDTLSNQEIMGIPIEKLSEKGFCFLWILSGTMDIGYQCLNKWGYECIDHLIWVKTTNHGRKAMVSHGFYFLHSTEMCLVGYKCPKGQTLNFNPCMHSNLIVSDVRKKSQKPDQLYRIIDQLMPGAKKMEIFARNNNLRQGWLSLGNQIGEVFEKWKNHMTCDDCERTLDEGVIRYKSRKSSNFDICENCIERVMQSRNENQSDYFRLENTDQKDVLHQYHKCDQCNVEPLWGTRFQCLECQNTDYCENCFDKLLQNKQGCYNHAFQAHEKPIAGHGLPVHYGKRCTSCFQKPIIGSCFICRDCSYLILCNFQLGQNCFFSFDYSNFDRIKGHDSSHKMEMITVRYAAEQMICSECSQGIQGKKYSCEQCLSYLLCEQCYFQKNLIQDFSEKFHTASHTFIIAN